MTGKILTSIGSVACLLIGLTLIYLGFVGGSINFETEGIIPKLKRYMRNNEQ